MLQKEIQEFSDSLEALRDFVDLVDPFLNERFKEVLNERRTDLIPLVLAGLRLSADSRPEDAQTEEQMKKAFDGEVLVTENSESQDKRLVTIQVSGRDAKKWTEALKELGKSGKRTELLYRSSLINLISTVEWFMSQLFHKYFDAHTDAVGSRENVFSLNDLKSFGSIEDAKNYLIDTKVENILRGSFEDWIQFLKNNAKVTMGYLDEHMDQLIEVFQRRNIIVHNGGVVNAIYLSKVAPNLKGKKKIGDRIIISRRYVDDAIGIFERTFVLIAAELWYRQTGEELLIAKQLESIAFEHLRKERWQVAEGLSKFVMTGKSLPEIRQLFAKLNYWQAVKWQGRYEEIRDEVESADFSGKGLASQLALHALANRVSEFFHLLPDVVTIDMKPELMGQKISYQDLETWPIFREIRQEPLYTKFHNEHSSEFVKSACEDQKQKDQASNNAKETTESDGVQGSEIIH